jgi:hypothetical protein
VRSLRGVAALAPVLGFMLACGTDDGTAMDPAGGDAMGGQSASAGRGAAGAGGATGGMSNSQAGMGASPMGGAGASSGSAGSDAGAGGSGGAASTPVTSDDYAADIAIEVHEDVHTILVVTWNQTLAAENTWLEFAFEGSAVMASREKSGEVGAHRDVVLGVPGETEVTISVMSRQDGQVYRSTPHTGTTDAVPAGMPVPTVLAYDADRASPERWLFGAVEDSGDDVAMNLSSYLSYPAWLYIMDRQGRIVWYYTDPSRNSPSGFPRVARDGEYIWAEQSRVGNQGRVIKMTLDREYFEVIDLPGLADAIDVTDDGSLLYDVGNSGELREMTRDGDVRTIWSCGSELDLEPNCYSNTINWNPIEDSVFMSFPEPGAVVEIDRTSGEMIGYYGNQSGAWDFAPPLENPPAQWRFGFQHFPNISPTGTLIVSSHMPGYEAFNTPPTANQHAFIEFAIDRENQTLTEVWRYTEGPEWPRSRGMAIRLESGNTLGNYGTGGVIREITPDKETVFHVKFDIPGGNDAYNKLVGHNVLIDDLYALNGGPR